MIAYAIRVDVIGNDTHTIMERFLEIYDKYLIYEEVADKTKKLHLQGILWHSGTETSLRTRWTESYPASIWPAQHDKKKSCTKVRNENYEIYITKDGNPKYIKNYSEEEISNLFKQSYKKEKIEKVKKQTFTELVIEKWDASPMSTKIRGGMRDRDDIKTWLIEEFHCLNKLWDTPVITKYTNFLEYRSNPRGHLKGILDASRDRY